MKEVDMEELQAKAHALDMIAELAEELSDIEEDGGLADFDNFTVFKIEDDGPVTLITKHNEEAYHFVDTISLAEFIVLNSEKIDPTLAN